MVPQLVTSKQPNFHLEQQMDPRMIFHLFIL